MVGLDLQTGWWPVTKIFNIFMYHYACILRRHWINCIYERSPNLLSSG